MLLSTPHTLARKPQNPLGLLGWLPLGQLDVVLGEQSIDFGFELGEPHVLFPHLLGFFPHLCVLALQPLGFGFDIQRSTQGRD